MNSSMKANPAREAYAKSLLALNAEYIRSVQESDVATFRKMLADDFMCTHPDGSFVGREEFLRQIGAPCKLTGLKAHDVLVRIEGTVAIVHARTTYTKPDGTPGGGRYTDIYAMRNGEWLAIAAHVTRQ